MRFQEESVVAGFTKQLQHTDVAVDLKVVIAAATVEIGVVAHTRSNTVDVAIAVCIRIVDYLYLLAINGDSNCL